MDGPLILFVKGSVSIVYYIMKLSWLSQMPLYQGIWCCSGKFNITTPGVSSSLSCFPCGTPHLNRLRLCLADFAFSAWVFPFLWPSPWWSTLIIRDYQSTIAVLIYYCNTSLECWSALVYHSATREKWQVTGTPDPDHFSKLYGLLLFYQIQQIKARKALLDCFHEAFKTFKYIYLYIFPLTLKH